MAEPRTVDVSELLVDAIVVVIRPEESRPTVRGFFRNDLDASRAVEWLASQPQLLEIVLPALRLDGRFDDLLDALTVET